MTTKPEYKTETIRDEKLIFQSRNSIMKYEKILSQKTEIFILLKKKQLPLHYLSFKKICSLSNTFDVENIRFTLYIDETEKTRPIEQFEIKKDEIVIPDYSSSYRPIDMNLESTQDTGKSKEQVNTAVFVLNKTNYKAIRVYRCIYPLFFLFGVLRILHLFFLSKHNEEINFNKYVIGNFFLIIFIFGTGIYGMYQMRNWYIKHFKFLNLTIAINVLLSCFLFYLPLNGNISGEKEYNYINENKLSHILFYVFLTILNALAIIFNYYIKNEYVRYLGDKIQESKLVMK